MAKQSCIFATSGNTGGYKLLTVFGANFPEILDAVCGASSPERQSIFRALIWTYIPGLVWMSRFDNSEKFLKENESKILKSLRSNIAYWMIIWPMLHLPKFFAFPFLIFTKIIKKCMHFNF